jgi:hypothetical protein
MIVRKAMNFSFDKDRPAERGNKTMARIDHLEFWHNAGRLPGLP